MRITLMVFIVTFLAGVVTAQTDTPTPVITIPTSESVFLTLALFSGTPGTMTRFDYSASAGDVLNGVLLALILFSVWGFFLVGVLVLRRRV